MITLTKPTVEPVAIAGLATPNCQALTGETSPRIPPARIETTKGR